MLEVKLDGAAVHSKPAPAQQCEQCGETTIRLVELGRCEQQAAAEALQSDRTASGNTVRYARRALGLSHAQLAAQLHVDENILKLWEMEQVEIPRPRQLELAQLVEKGN